MFSTDKGFITFVFGVLDSGGGGYGSGVYLDVGNVCNAMHHKYRRMWIERVRIEVVLVNGGGFVFVREEERGWWRDDLRPEQFERSSIVHEILSTPYRYVCYSQMEPACRTQYPCTQGYHPLALEFNSCCGVRSVDTGGGGGAYANQSYFPRNPFLAKRRGCLLAKSTGPRDSKRC